MRKESKYELRHLGGAGEWYGEVGRRGLSFLFVDLRKRVDPRVETAALCYVLKFSSSLSIHS